MKRILTTLIFIPFFFLAATPAHAQLCNGDRGIDSAIGCIPVFSGSDLTPLAAYIIRWGVGIGGGIAFLLILYAGFQIITSQGVPEKIKAGRELITAALSGLLLIIFAVFILEFIGVDILGLPLGS